MDVIGGIQKDLNDAKKKIDWYEYHLLTIMGDCSDKHGYEGASYWVLCSNEKYIKITLYEVKELSIIPFDIKLHSKDFLDFVTHPDDISEPKKYDILEHIESIVPKNIIYFKTHKEADKYLKQRYSILDRILDSIKKDH